METHTEKFKVRLGLFIIGGLTLFVAAIFIIGKQQNLFDSVFKVSANFYNVSGLQVGNTVRFSGIPIGVIDNIQIINDSTAKVDMLIKKDYKKFIKSDSKATIGSEGIIGDRLITISQGASDSPSIKHGQMISSVEPVETDEIMADMQVSVSNIAIITNELAEIMIKINKGEGTIGRLLQDSTIAENLDMTILNLRKSSKGLNENMNAAKENIFFRGYFKRKRKAEEKERNN
ncbi:MAG: MlaD family protein [Bacteroidales bacterium]|nr:MlaD family protein [Bacteroidales bacterium]